MRLGPRSCAIAEGGGCARVLGTGLGISNVGGARQRAAHVPAENPAVDHCRVRPWMPLLMSESAVLRPDTRFAEAVCYSFAFKRPAEGTSGLSYITDLCGQSPLDSIQRASTCRLGLTRLQPCLLPIRVRGC